MPGQMNSSQKLVSALNPQYFWDVDLSAVNQATSCRLIIERVFSLGEIKEMKEVIRYYGVEKTLDVLRNLTFIDRKSLNFISRFFNVPSEEFKCYSIKQSKPIYWNL